MQHLWIALGSRAVHECLAQVCCQTDVGEGGPNRAS